MMRLLCNELPFTFAQCVRVCMFLERERGIAPHLATLTRHTYIKDTACARPAQRFGAYIPQARAPQLGGF
jgi:hypothetical protein